MFILNLASAIVIKDLYHFNMAYDTLTHINDRCFLLSAFDMMLSCLFFVYFATADCIIYTPKRFWFLFMSVFFNMEFSTIVIDYYNGFPVDYLLDHFCTFIIAFNIAALCIVFKNWVLNF